MTANPPAATPVLVVNAGSSSIKLALCDRKGRRLWQEQRSWGAPGVVIPATGGAAAPEQSLEVLLGQWLAPLLRDIQPRADLVVHRLVHGGSRFTTPTALTAEVRGALAELVPLAPLHNGPALSVIQWLAEQLGLEQWACFDTAFHASLAEPAFTYAIPEAWRQQGLRRFGFHGLNHQHVGETAALTLRPPLRLISCHLGAGCSLCAIAIDSDGVPRSVDSTMGFTPLEGLVMASRSGSVDPGLLLHLLRSGVEASELDLALNRRSGLLGLSGLSGDMRELRRQAAAGHGGSQLAIAVFRHRLLQGIGAMAASLGGVDAIALTGGIGEHDECLAAELEKALAWLAPLQWLRVPADEEGLMVRHCVAARLGEALA
ncbi:MAG: acetate kinase [Cyanobacteriota bacterium]|nr:acetate kinase [Cyanobacteriota bacterium]